MGVLIEITVMATVSFVLSVALSVLVGSLLHRRAAGPIRLIPIPIRREVVVPIRRQEVVGQDWRA